MAAPEFRSQVQVQADGPASIGRGTVHDASFFGNGNSNARGGDGAVRLSMPLQDAGPTPSRSHYFLTRREAMKGAANRFVHSTTYLWLYGGMAAASFFTVLLSLSQSCPGTLFYALELVINATLIAEVSMRCFAFGKQFWKSTFNVVDLCLVLLCAITLAVIFYHHDCSAGPDHGDREGHGGDDGHRSGKGEELLDSILLIIRNVAQGIRLVAVVRRSGSNVSSRVPAIDLNAARGYSIDFDLEEEGSRARERMALGGDRSAQAHYIAGGRSFTPKPSGGTAEERAALFDHDQDDDDEL